jgi:hypothetical protein
MAIAIGCDLGKWNTVTLDELRPLLPSDAHCRLRCRVDGFPVLFIRQKGGGILKYVVVRGHNGQAIALLEQARNVREHT